MGVPSVAVGVTASAVVSTGPSTYRGLSVRDTSNVANTITVYDGTDNTGTVLATFALAALESALDNVDGGVWAAHGLYFESTGAVEGSVRVG